MKFDSVIDLEKQIIYHSDKYYNDEAEISDAAFDEMLMQLKILNPNSQVLKQVGSKVKKVSKVKHHRKMGSLEKVHDTSWLANRNSVIVMPKLDGISTEIIYEKGIAVQASTRGDGEFGEDLLPHVKNMSCVNLGIDFTGAVYGEMIMRNSVFQEKYAGEYANSRNLVAGISHRLDASGAEDCEILLFDYNFADYTADKVKNFTVPTLFLENGAVEKYTPEIIEAWKDLPNDGLVWLDIKTGERVAYKFPAEKATVEVKEVKWNLSKNGNLIPILNFEPVNLAGAQISNCTCNNAGWIVNKKIGTGSKIVIQRANEVIPNLVEVLTEQLQQIPQTCPVCNSKLEFDSVHLKCGNEECAEKKFYDLMVFWQTLGLKEFAEAWFREIYKNGVDAYWKCLSLKVEDLTKFGITEYSANKFIGKVKEAWLNCSPAQYLAGLNIPGASVKTFEAILDYFKINSSANFRQIFELSPSEFYVIARISSTAVANIEKYLSQKAWLNEELCSNFKSQEIENKLNGLSFCFTGKLFNLKRADAEKKVKLLGGKISSVNADLDYLVTNDTESGSSKNLKAKEFDVKIISEKEFLELLKTLEE